MTDIEIRGGIEWWRDDGQPGDMPMEMASCARCGSSADFLPCWNCDHGFVERDFGDDVVSDLVDVPCEYCHGVGGSWHCLSTPEWCQANTIPGRDHIASTALNARVWSDR